MSASYRIQVIRVDHGDWQRELSAAVTQEMADLGLHVSVSVDIGPTPPSGEPAVAVFFGSPSAAADSGCLAAVHRATASRLAVVPVVTSLAGYTASVPPSLQLQNGWEWSGVDPARRLARFLLEELGIEERQRQVFISYPRSDGMYAAEQLHDSLGKHGFEPFLDRFHIRAAADFQARIADALEEHAFLLLLETPKAHASKWVYLEVDYALSHTMGIHIVTWPGAVTPVPGSPGLPRRVLQPGDLTVANGYDAFPEAVLDEIVGDVEAAHAWALVRRRRQLLCSVEDAALAKGLSCTPLPGWRLLVEGGGRRDLVAVASRLPHVDDLFDLDEARLRAGPVSTYPAAVLVHAARKIDKRRKQILDWASGGRHVTLVPENAIGGHW